MAKRTTKKTEAPILGQNDHIVSGVESALHCIEEEKVDIVAVVMVVRVGVDFEGPGKDVYQSGWS